MEAGLGRGVRGWSRLSRRGRLLFAGAAALLLVVVVVALARGRGTPATAPAAASLQHISVMVPGRRAITGTVTASGLIAARHDMPVGVVGEGGRVTEVLVYPGDWVAAGQPLAVIERSVQVQQAAGLAAAVRAARAEAALAQANLDRARSLVANGFISKADIDTKTAARDGANARVALAGAQLAEQQARNARLVIRAPARGLVLTRTVEPGQIVLPQAVLFRVAESGNMEMLARLAEQDLARMRLGLPVQVTPVGSSRTLTGSIWQLSPVIDPQTRQGVARVALAFDPALRPGGFANARVSSGTVEQPLLPESAVLSDSRGNYVLIVGPNDVVTRREVRVGDVGESGVAIAGGLDGSERVVMSAGAFLSPGQRIAPDLVRQAG